MAEDVAGGVVALGGIEGLELYRGRGKGEGFDDMVGCSCSC